MGRKNVSKKLKRDENSKRNKRQLQSKRNSFVRNMKQIVKRGKSDGKKVA